MSKPNLFSVIALLSLLALPVSATEVEIMATPDGGLQPRLITDADGGIHLLYFKKRLDRREAREGSLYYRAYEPTQGIFGLPVRVSSEAFNLQTFSIARAGMAIDGTGRLHVVWYLPRQSQFYYTRSNPERTAFEPQRAMISEYQEGIDAGADIAAFGNDVALVWGAGDLSREYERTVYARISSDNGASFGPESRIGNPDIGACACCSLAADISTTGTLNVAYRSAINGIGRHMQFLNVSYGNNVATGASYEEVHPLQEWEVSFCPLSTNDYSSSPADAHWLVFETASRIVEKRLDTDDEPRAVAEPYSETRQKNPTVAINADGERLIAWGEAIAHPRGGRLNMRLIDSEQVSHEVLSEDEAVNIQDFSFPAAASLPDGSFLVLY